MSAESREPEHMRIRVYPDEMLRRGAAVVRPEQLAGEAAELASAMLKTMYDEAGVGLAAPQVGVPLRVIVIDPSPERDSPTVLVNPVLREASGREVEEEGCLSVPGITAKVGRRERIAVEYETLEGEKAGLETDGLLARVVQHELDHLEGRLFIDRLGPAGRLAVREALRELEESAKDRK